MCSDCYICLYDFISYQHMTSLVGSSPGILFKFVPPSCSLQTCRVSVNCLHAIVKQYVIVCNACTCFAVSPWLFIVSYTSATFYVQVYTFSVSIFPHRKHCFVFWSLMAMFYINISQLVAFFCFHICFWKCFWVSLLFCNICIVKICIWSCICTRVCTRMCYTWTHTTHIPSHLIVPLIWRY